MTKADSPNSGLPNFTQLNRLPITDVARTCGCDVEVEKTGKTTVERIFCPRSSEHKPRTSPYLRILASSNRVVCESCNTYPMSVLDFVQEFGEFETLLDAAEYVQCHYPGLPRKSRASFLNNPTGEALPPGCRNPWTLLISSGIYAQLAVPSRLLIPILLECARWKDEGGDCRIHLSQRAMMRFSGIGSFTGISEALTELAAIGFLQRLPVRRRERSPERETAEYVLTPLSQRIMEFAATTAAKLGAAISQDKRIQTEMRRERDRKRMWSHDRSG